jgi:nitroreductase
VERFDRQPARAPFHGLVGGLTSDRLAALTAAAKVPYVMRIVGAEGLSARMAASMLEIDRSLTTWPHLAGDAMQAAAAAVMAVRRLAPGARLPSGRVHLDIAGALDAIAEPVVPAELPPFTVFGDYRNLAEPTTDVMAIVRAGQLAPSGGNAQPWRITPRDNHVDLELDQTRSTAMDVAYRASQVGLGAALLNMRIAAAARGVLGPVDPLPGGGARLWLGRQRDERLVELCKPMFARTTNRRLSDPDRPVPAADLRALAVAAEAEQAELRVIVDRADMAAVARILADTDRIRFLLPDLHREMMAELVDPRTGPVERGLDVRTLELGPATGLLDLLRRPDVVGMLADWDAAASAAGAARGYGTALADRMRALVESSSALVAVTVTGAAAGDYRRGGAAMQRMWITATAAGIATQPIVPLFLYTRADSDQGVDELAALGGRYTARLRGHRQLLRELFALAPAENFAIVFRLGFAPAPTAISLRSADVVTQNARDRPKRSKQ